MAVSDREKWIDVCYISEGATRAKRRVREFDDNRERRWRRWPAEGRAEVSKTKRRAVPSHFPVAQQAAGERTGEPVDTTEPEDI